MDENEIITIPVLYEKIKVANHRIDNLEQKTDELTDFKYTVNSLSETVKDLKVTVAKINNKDSNNYNSIKLVIATAIITALISYLINIIL